MFIIVQYSQHQANCHWPVESFMYRKHVSKREWDARITRQRDQKRWRLEEKNNF